MKQAKLGRTAGHRRALFRSIITALILHERIHTTEAKAKQVRPLAEEIISLAKRGDLPARRLAAATVQDKEALKKLFETIGPKYRDRQGGYTRIVRLAPRRGDAAPVVILELV
ncbi:MAG TPA: 50S ribosomal protein L17 [Firmicutes bacterium]|nr:50S ribosomal protein L17 [Bacillota bacterium]